jgi:hypothetical protein
MSRKKIKQHICANCNFQFSTNSGHTNFCPNCGQENHNPRFPLVHYGYELLEGFLHFDTKFFHSLKVLLFKPGKITFDYIHNIRGRYTPPFRMFIFMSIFGLLMMGIYETHLLKKGLFGETKAAQDKNITIGDIFDKSADSVQDEILVAPFTWIMKNPTTTNAALRSLKNIPKDSLGDWLINNGYQNNFITRFFAINKKIRISRQMTVAEVVTMVTGIFKWLFLIMIPINAIICFFVFYRRNLFFYDSMLFSIHFSCFFLIFFTLLLSGTLLLEPISTTSLYIYGLLLFVLLIVYLYTSMKKVFSFSWFSTLIRMALSFLLSFTVFQLIHAFISNHSGR